MRFTHLFRALIFIALFCRKTPAADWPQWHGPDRDGKSSEKGLLKSWPEKGPELALTITNIGKGWSSPVIADGKIVVTGMSSESNDVVFCFDTNGKELWQNTNGPSWFESWPAARASPAIVDRTVYAISGKGRVAAFKLSDGNELWAVDVFDRFKAGNPKSKRHGTSECVLVEGNNVICTPGAQEAFVAALDRKTGDTVWATKGVKSVIEHSSPIAFTFNGLRQLAVLTGTLLAGIDATTGQLLWKDPFWKGENCTTPIYADGYIVAASRDKKNGGAVQLELDRSKNPTIKGPAWASTNMDCYYGSYISVGDAIHTTHGQALACLDLKTGSTRYLTKGIGASSFIYADGHLYCLNENGVMRLIEPTSDTHNVISTFKIPNAGQQTFAHPVIANGRLFIRKDTKLFIYNISGTTS